MELIKAEGRQTMTSREISELVESRHADVCRTIDRLMKDGAISRYAPSAYTHPQNGQEYWEYHIGKRDSYVVVAQLSPEFTARLVDRWQELEAAVAAPSFAIPTTLSGALRLAAEQAELIEQQAAQIEAAKPALEFVDRYVGSTGAKGFREVCKVLQVKEPEFRKFLVDAKIMYKLGGEWVPYSDHLDTGRFVVKAGTSESNGHAFNSAKFTPKGINWIAGEWAKYQIRGKA